MAEATYQPRLLSIPAEIRNHIYDFVLIQSPYVHVTNDLTPPALLATCRQLRTEGLSVWYSANRFRIEIWDLDTTDLDKFNHLYRLQTHNNLAKIHIKMLGQPSWANLVKWCNKLHQQKYNCLDGT